MIYINKADMPDLIEVLQLLSKLSAKPAPVALFNEMHVAVENMHEHGLDTIIIGITTDPESKLHKALVAAVNDRQADSSVFSDYPIQESMLTCRIPAIFNGMSHMGGATFLQFGAGDGIETRIDDVSGTLPESFVEPAAAYKNWVDSI